MIRIRRENVISFLLHALLLAAAYLLQAELFSRVKLFGVTPTILPMTAVAVALYEGGTRGCVYGLCCGLLCDVAFARPAALFTVGITVIAFLVGWLGDTVMHRSFPAYAVLCLGALIVTAFLQMFRLLFIDGSPALPLLFNGLVQILVSLIFLLPVYWASRPIASRAESARV